MPSIRDFSGGVLNQELQNRDNGNGILFDCKNVLSSWNGELRKRTGTRWLKSLEGNSKIIPYRLPNGDDMIMVLRDGKIDCYEFDESNNLIPYYEYTYGNNMNFPMTNWSSAVQDNWTISGNGYPDTEYYKIYNVFSNITQELFGGYFYDKNTVLSKNAYFQIYNSVDNFVLKSAHVIWTSEIFGDDSSWYVFGTDPLIQFSDDGNTWISVKTSCLNIKRRYYYDSNYFFGTGFNIYECDVEIDESVNSHKYWRIVFVSCLSNTINTALVGGVVLNLQNIQCFSSSGKTLVSFSGLPYESEDLDNIRWSQNDKSLILVSKGKTPFEIKRSVGVLVCNQFVPSDYSTIWTSLGDPACVVYYQNRLWFGGFDLFPTRVYGSEFGKFDKFNIPDTIVATSPIMADGTEISNVIENMWGGNNALYCLSEDGVSMIDAQGAIVATDQIEFKLRNREPVDAMVPTVKDDIMIYLGRDKRKILVTDYDFVVQRFRANCISDNYNNFLQSGIKELHYIPRKSSLIYGVLENGKWFAQLFSTDKSKNALYPFETNGHIFDVQPIKKGDETKLLMITQLPSYQYILEEKLPQPDQEIMDFMTKQEKQDYTTSVISSDCYLDHAINRRMSVSTTEVGNLPYYDEQKVEVIADGQYIGEKQIMTRDSSNLYAWECSVSDVPLLYTSVERPTSDDSVYDGNFTLLNSYKINSATAVIMLVQMPYLATLLGYSQTDEEPNNVYTITRLPRHMIYDENGILLGLATSASDERVVFNGVTYYRNSEIDTTATINAEYSYEREQTKDKTTTPYYLTFDEEINNMVIGQKYDSYAVLKFVSPYNMRKFPKEISVNFINSGYAELGNTFDSLKPVLHNIVDSVTINNKPILMNGNYTMTLDKQTFETPYVIIRSDKGLPFIITGIDYKVDMSNYQGGV